VDPPFALVGGPDILGGSSIDMGSLRASRMRDLELSVARSELEYTGDNSSDG
jgi:hypothetical protein